MKSSVYNRRLGLLLLTESDVMNLIKEKTGKDFS
jgi:hypothetical protein